MALTDKLTAIADAIRAKGGTTDLLTLDGMVEAINAIKTGGGATDITDSVVSVAFSSTAANEAYAGFDGIVPKDVKIAILFWQGEQSNAANNQCLLAILPRAYLSAVPLTSRLLYCRLRDSSYDFQYNSNNIYDLIVNAGDTFRMVVIR